jgi:hypothetical protein
MANAAPNARATPSARATRRRLVARPEPPPTASKLVPAAVAPCISTAPFDSGYLPQMIRRAGREAKRLAAACD